MSVELTAASREALLHLRDPAGLTWMIVPLIAITIAVYAAEIERRRWSLVFAGLAFWGMDWLNEIANAVVLHATGRSALWTAPGRSMFIILVGLNVEICFMFSIAGVVLTRMLPTDRRLRVLGLPNRLVFALASSVFCVLVEVLLNRADLLIWEYPFWSARHPWLIVPFGYLHFHIVAFWVHDLGRPSRQAAVVGAIWALAAIGVAVFGLALRWL